MQSSSLYPPIYVLGNGQLGRMLRYAGTPLDINVIPLPFDGETINIEPEALVTAEIERWPHTPLTEQLAKHPHFLNQSIFTQLADRYTQKTLLDQLNLTTAPWCLVETPQQWQSVFQTIQSKVVVKRRTGGYDGRGQWIIEENTLQQITDDLYGEIIAEAFIPFDFEISIVGARFRNNETRFYPISRNLQQNGILRYSIANIHFDGVETLQQQAEQMLSTIMHKLDYVGVMAMECFVIGDQLLINELAPRVHNSGHWTQLGCPISQFELHLRALLDLPTPPLEALYPSVMVNLIGIEHCLDWLNIPYSQLHWYGKEVRLGRKLGHLNLCHSSTQSIIKSLQQLRHSLSEDYQSGLDWVIDRL